MMMSSEIAKIFLKFSISLCNKFEIRLISPMEGFKLKLIKNNLNKQVAHYHQRTYFKTVHSAI